MELYIIKYKTPVSGQFMGIYGWKDGYNGPYTQTEARRISALIGCELIPVTVDVRDLIAEKVEEDKFMSEASALDLSMPRPEGRKSYHAMLREMTDADFDYKSITEGKKTLDDIKDAYNKFLETKAE
jgi:hypothetical protein